MHSSQSYNHNSTSCCLLPPILTSKCTDCYITEGNVGSQNSDRKHKAPGQIFLLHILYLYSFYFRVPGFSSIYLYPKTSRHRLTTFTTINIPSSSRCMQFLPVLPSAALLSFITSGFTLLKSLTVTVLWRVVC
jgi:hypothetical protein